MLKYAKIFNEKTKQCEVGLGTNTEFYKSIGMVEMEVEQAYNGSWYVAGNAPKKPQSEKEKEIRAVRSEYFDKYVDFYQSKPLYWEELDEETKQYISEYRVYLKDYTKEDNWWEQNPLDYDTWKERSNYAKGNSYKTIRENIQKLLKEGKSIEEATKLAYQYARIDKKKKES